MNTITGNKLLAYGKGTGRKLEFYFVDPQMKKDQSAATEQVQTSK